MGLANPSEFPDKASSWNEEFDRRRRADMLRLLTDDVIAEHEANPLGYRHFHSWPLQRVLNYFRAQPVLGKYFVYASKPWHEYRIAVVVGRGEPAEILEEPVFATEEEAMHGVFMRRVRRAPRAGRLTTRGGADEHDHDSRVLRCSERSPGETIRFFVSSDRPGEYRADIVRLVHGDTNPKGPGFKEELLETRVSGSYPARFQRTQFGSYVEIADRGALHPRGGLTVHAFVWPTTPTRGRQGIVSRWADDVKAGWALAIEDGVLVFSMGDGSGTVSSVVSDRPLFQEVWYSVTASYDPGDASLALRQESVVNRVNSVFGPIVPLDSDTTMTATSAAVPGDATVPVIVAGLSESSDGDRTWCIAPFNGKIDAAEGVRACARRDGVGATGRRGARGAGAMCLRGGTSRLG